MAYIFISEVVNGGWGTWGSFGRCSKTCGGGHKTRTRRCDNPAPSTNGANCPGSTSQSVKCNTKTCCKFYSLFESQQVQWVICLPSICSNVIVLYHVFPIACGVDRHPRNMPCRKAYSCHKLAARKGCNKKFTQVLPNWCWQKLSNRDRRQLVKTYCRKSCKNCLGKDLTHFQISHSCMK